MGQAVTTSSTSVATPSAVGLGVVIPVELASEEMLPIAEPVSSAELLLPPAQPSGGGPSWKVGQRKWQRISAGEVLCVG